MNLKKLAALAVTLSPALLLPLSADAHRAWLLPAATVLSGEAPWVTVDGAVSNDIFHINYVPLRLEQLTVLAPDGETVEKQNPHTGKQRSSFDLQLQQPGTYKVVSVSSGLRARWESEEGERRFWPARGQQPSAGEFDKAVPKQAKNLQVTLASRRMETFITAGAPTDTVLKPTGQGLEMQPQIHPNDLFAGEVAQFRFLMDGEPVAGVKVAVIRDGMRYRNQQETLELVSDKNGLVEVDWPQAGMYWLEAEYEDDQAAAPASKRQGSYIATLEVLPQ